MRAAQRLRLAAAQSPLVGECFPRRAVESDAAPAQSMWQAAPWQGAGASSLQPVAAPRSGAVSVLAQLLPAAA
jgi:hypothetical protein